MGSLMSGWSSTALGDAKRVLVRLMRNRSLTNEEVDAFWRQRGRPEQPENNGQQESPALEARRLDGNRSLPSPLARGSNGGQHLASHSEPSLPVTRRPEGFTESSAAADHSGTSCDWWTRSSWAFLNEPPHI